MSEAGRRCFAHEVQNRHARARAPQCVSSSTPFSPIINSSSPTGSTSSVGGLRCV